MYIHHCVARQKIEVLLSLFMLADFHVLHAVKCLGEGMMLRSVRIPHIPAAVRISINPLNSELNPICYLLALLGVHHFLHVSRIRVKLLTISLLMSYIYMERLFLMFLDHTQRRSTVGRTPLDE